MNEWNKEAEEFYQELPESFKEFASIVYATLKGYTKEESRDVRLNSLLKQHPDWTCDDIPERLQRFFDSAEESYADDRIFFTNMLYYLCGEVCISKKLCLRVAEWLNQQGRVSNDHLKETIKALSYLCGTKEETALEYLSVATFQQLYDAYCETIDCTNDALLTPWVPDHVKKIEGLFDNFNQ